MRTLPTQLSSAMDAGSYLFYVQLRCRYQKSLSYYPFTPTRYKLTGTTMHVEFPSPSPIFQTQEKPQDWEFKLLRGVTIGGSNYTIESSWFYGVRGEWINSSIVTADATLLPNLNYTDPDAGTKTYQQVIEDLLAAYGKTASYKPFWNWRSNDFYPDGASLTLKSAFDFFALLQQKQIVFAADNGNEEILFFCPASFNTFATEYNITSKDYTLGLTTHYRRFLSIDEHNVIHYSGNPDAELWNLGYVNSADLHPAFAESWQGFRVLPDLQHLKYQDFDKIRLYISPTSQAGFIGLVTETFNTANAPGFQTFLTNIPWADAGG